MRKNNLILGLLICLIIPSLTSCQVNWLGKHYDVPWWSIAIPVAVILFAVWFLFGRYIAAKPYICPKCGKVFHPKWWKSAFTIHMGNDRLFKCPHCKNKGFCHISEDLSD